MWQFKNIDRWHEKRKNIFNYYIEKLSFIDGIICPNDVNDGEKHAYHLFVIQIKSQMWEINRNQIIEKLNHAGVGTSGTINQFICIVITSINMAIA